MAYIQDQEIIAQAVYGAFRGLFFASSWLGRATYHLDVAINNLMFCLMSFRAFVGIT